MDRRRFLLASGASALALATGCSSSAATGPRSSDDTTVPAPRAATTTIAPTTVPDPVAGTPAEVLDRSHVPVLCFHQLREFESDDSEYARTIITPPGVLRSQLEALGNGGYHPVTAAAVIDHLQFGKSLPDKPVLLSFDDGSVTHHTVALPLLTELGFPGIFFPMTVVLNKERWLSEDNLREMDAAGLEIGAHTWDHQRMDRLKGDEWSTQIVEPKARLEKILSHPVDTFAFPYGLWTQESLDHIADAGFRAAFQLADDTDPVRPLLTVRRIQPPPTWDPADLVSNLERGF